MPRAIQHRLLLASTLRGSRDLRGSKCPPSGRAARQTPSGRGFTVVHLSYRCAVPGWFFVTLTVDTCNTLQGPFLASKVVFPGVYIK